MAHKARILIVDDEEDICFFSKSMLEKTGKFQVTTTTSAREAIELARETPPDLIMLDVNMPELDGGDVARELEGFEKTRNIPILFVTALLRKEEEARGARGRHHYLAKPVKPQELIEKIELLLNPPAA